MKTTTANLAGLVAIIAGIVFVVAGGVTWYIVTDQLTAEEITVPEDSAFLPGDDVNGPLSAYAQAQIINEHALAASGGATYAELGALAAEAEAAGDEEAAAEYEAQRETVMTASFLRASLFTSVVSYGVAALVIGLGVLFVLVGMGMRNLAQLGSATSDSARP